MEESNRMKTIAEDILNAREETFAFQKLDIPALVRRTVEILRTHEKFEGVDWDLRLADRLELRGDPELLRECLMNLFLNAADAMREHGSAVRSISVTAELDRETDRVCVVVRDSGPGIPPQYRAKVFDVSFSMKRDGHGFGLSKTYQVIARHGGQIDVADTPPGEGACFVITLPVQGPPATDDPGAAAA
jgi:signal transduction histidine kinase